MALQRADTPTAMLPHTAAALLESLVADVSHFREILSTSRRADELAGDPRKVVAGFCNFVPDELVLAAGAVPIRLCGGDHDAARAAEREFPRDACALIKASLGSFLSEQPLYRRADLVVVPTSCDGKKKLASFLSGTKPVHVLEVPPYKASARAIARWLEAVSELKALLESFTGTRITRDLLRSAIELTNERQKAFKRLYRLKQSCPAVLPGTDALTVAGASFYDDVERFTRELTRLNDALQVPASGGTEDAKVKAPRVLLAGAPLIYPNFRLADLVEKAGAVIAVDELCSGTQRLYHRVVPSEWTMGGMLRAVAEKYLLPCTCPCFVENTDRLHRLVELTEQFQVDGVIHHNLRICQLFDIERAAVRREMQQRGIPVLDVHMDYSPEDVAQVTTRVEAFLEMLRSRQVAEVASRMGGWAER